MANLDFLKKESKKTGFGVDISGAASASDALKMGGLDWHVEKMPIYYGDVNGYTEIPNTYATVRKEDGRQLGIVTGRYDICQNKEAFEFTDELIGLGVKFDRAGSFYGGRKTWLSAHLPDDRNILGDAVHQNLVFLNSHDGSSGVRILIAPLTLPRLKPWDSLYGSPHHLSLNKQTCYSWRFQDSRTAEY